MMDLFGFGKQMMVRAIIVVLWTYIEKRSTSKLTETFDAFSHTACSKLS